MDRTAGPDGGGPTEATPLTSSVPPSPAPMSDADADADRMGEELLGLSSEDDSYEWIRRSLNLLPVDESAAEAADPVEDVPSGMRKTRSASAGRGHHHGGGIGGSSQGLRRVTTYGGGGAAATFSERTARWEELPSSQPAWRQQHRPGSPSGSVPSGKVACMVLIAFAATAGLAVGLLGVGRGRLVGPSRQPVGAYRLVELQEAEAFWDYYNFYVGPDSVGSNGFNSYIGRERALQLGIANVTREVIPSDERSAAVDPSGNGEETAGVGTAKERVVDEDKASVFADSSDFDFDSDSEPFIYMGSAPTADGPREAIRLEGRRRFNRGLFIIDLRHMPTGCGIWPAFWLTDEANWPLNGEIDIVEGINFQSVAKTALHSTKVCKMDDVPIGTKTGTWDNSTGIPNKKTGIPDPTPREATNCFVYDPHQWLNQGCVAVESRDGTLGKPLNDKGGGVFVLDWDPINRHIRTWAFTPHGDMPRNLADSIRTASKPAEERVAPDPDKWGLPYGYFPIGDSTNCPASHFKNMRLVFNLAFCGSVAGNRYNMDCPNEAKKQKTCNAWITSEPEELDEVYWKIRGVYVYQRDWVARWV